ncbi:MAG: hypothetical protein JWL72_2466, partial [Ilumatobacteraceae bacterium]|nr:hypothetical protein [Ilumatobacteraceae bacterium]
DDPTLTIARLSRVLENHGTGDLSLPQYRVLGLLSSGEERASLLAARLSVAKPTLTSLVDSLVERGFVVRETLHGDRRAVRLSITEAGRATLTASALQLRTVLDTVLDRCADPAVALAGLEQLGAALDSLWAARLAEQPVGDAVGGSR